MSKKKKKERRPRPLPKRNEQIPNSMIRPFDDIRPSPILEHARELPFHGCWVMEDWKNAGITPVIVARKQEKNRILFGAYIVDIFCLGIKDAYTRWDYSLNHFEHDLPGMCGGAPLPCSVEFAHELIYGALEYARKIGFEPAPDFHNLKADQILDPADAHPRTNGITFGKDGKPFYVAGPYDGDMKTRFVLDTLTRTCGPGNFHYVTMLDDIT